MLRIPLPEDDGFALCTASVECGNVKILPLPIPIPVNREAFSKLG